MQTKGAIPRGSKEFCEIGMHKKTTPIIYIPHFPRKSEQTPHQAQIFRTFFEDRGNTFEKTDQLILFRFMGLFCY